MGCNSTKAVQVRAIGDDNPETATEKNRRHSLKGESHHPFVLTMMKDYWSLDDWMTSMYNNMKTLSSRVDTFVCSMDELASGLAEFAKLTDDEVILQNSQKVLDACAKITRTDDPNSAISVFHRDIRERILTPMHELTTHGRVRTNELLESRKIMHHDVSSGNSRLLSEAELALAKSAFTTADCQLFAWLHTFEDLRSDILDSILQSFKVAQFTFFTTAANAISACLPPQLEFRPLVEMTLERMETEIEVEMLFDRINRIDDTSLEEHQEYRARIRKRVAESGGTTNAWCADAKDEETEKPKVDHTVFGIRWPRSVRRSQRVKEWLRQLMEADKPEGNISAFRGCWMSRTICDSTKAASAIWTIKQEGTSKTSGSVIWPEEEGGGKLNIEVASKSVVSTVDNKRHGFLSADGQMLIWSWGQVWTRTDARKSKKSSKCRKTGQGLDGLAAALPDLTYSPQVADRVFEVPDPTTFEELPLNKLPEPSEDVEYNEMLRDFDSFDKGLRGVYAKILSSIRGIDGMMNALRNVSKTLCEGSSEMGDQDIVEFSSALKVAIEHIVSIDDPRSATSKFRRDIRFNILGPTQHHIHNNQKIRDCFASRDKSLEALKSARLNYDSSKTSQAKTELDLATYQFNKIDEQVYEWLSALDEYRDDIVDSIAETMKSLQSTVLTSCAHEISKVLPDWEAFRPLASMRPENVEAEVDEFVHNSCATLDATSQNVGVNILQQRLIYQGYKEDDVHRILKRALSAKDVQGLDVHDVLKEVHGLDVMPNVVFRRSMKGVRVPLTLRRPGQKLFDMDENEVLGEVPCYWTSKEVAQCVRMPVSDDITEAIQDLLNSTWSHVWTCDRVNKADMKKPEVPNFQVVDVQRNENVTLWRKYFWRRERLRVCATTSGFKRYQVKTSSCSQEKVTDMIDQMDLVSEANEFLLFHGTTPQSIEGICDKGFDMNKAGSRRGTLYGRGIYFAENSTKADEYAAADAGIYTMLLCRVACGICRYTEQTRPDPHDLVDSVKLTNTYNAVIGDRVKAKGTYREFIVYEEDQVYPEYVVRYCRVSPSPKS